MDGAVQSQSPTAAVEAEGVWRWTPLRWTGFTGQALADWRAPQGVDFCGFSYRLDAMRLPRGILSVSFVERVRRPRCYEKKSRQL